VEGGEKGGWNRWRENKKLGSRLRTEGWGNYKDRTSGTPNIRILRTLSQNTVSPAILEYKYLPLYIMYTYVFNPYIKS